MKIFGPKFLIVIGILTFLALLYFTFTVVNVGFSNCQDIQHLNASATASLNRGLKALNDITYYKQHPDEKAQQAALIKQQLKDFQPQSCKHIFSPWG